MLGFCHRCTDRYARGTGAEDLLDVVGCNAADRYIPDALIDQDVGSLPDIIEADRRDVRLCPRGKNGPERRVRRSLLACGAQLLERMSALAYNQRSPLQLAGLLNRQIVLAHVQSIGAGGYRNIHSVVYDTQNAGISADSHERLGKGKELVVGDGLCAKLDAIGSA